MPGTTRRDAAFLSPRRGLADLRDDPQLQQRSAENLDITGMTGRESVVLPGFAYNGF